MKRLSVNDFRKMNNKSYIRITLSNLVALLARANLRVSVEEGRMQSQANNGHIYWVYRRSRYYKVYDDPIYLISLDTTSMEFSFAKLPHCLSSCAFEAGETKDVLLALFI
jgi:hypothetical protein